MRPTTRKGRLRLAIEQRIGEACERGMRAIILRAGDFYGHGRGDWFDLVITRDLSSGRITYPAPPDILHEWAYLPDFAAALVRLTNQRADLPPLAEFGFPGHAVTGRELVDAIERVLGRGCEVKRMGWWLIKALRPFLAMSRELAEIEYLWRKPHRISGERLAAAIGTVPHTPLDRALAHALGELGSVPRDSDADTVVRSRG